MHHPYLHSDRCFPPSALDGYWLPGTQPPLDVHVDKGSLRTATPGRSLTPKPIHTLDSWTPVPLLQPKPLTLSLSSSLSFPYIQETTAQPSG